MDKVTDTTVREVAKLRAEEGTRGHAYSTTGRWFPRKGQKRRNMELLRSTVASIKRGAR